MDRHLYAGAAQAYLIGGESTDIGDADLAGQFDGRPRAAAVKGHGHRRRAADIETGDARTDACGAHHSAAGIQR